MQALVFISLWVHVVARATKLCKMEATPASKALLVDLDLDTAAVSLRAGGVRHILLATSV